MGAATIGFPRRRFDESVGSGGKFLQAMFGAEPKGLAVVLYFPFGGVEVDVHPAYGVFDDMSHPNFLGYTHRLLAVVPG